MPRSSHPASDPASDLDPALHFLRALWELNHSLERASRSMKNRFGVTGPERLFVRIVGRRPGITPAEVADVLRVHRSSVTPLIKRLEARRLVSRRANAADARSFQLYLTRAGEQIDSMREGTIEAVVRAAVDASRLSDVAVSISMLGTVAARLTASTNRSRAGARKRAAR